MADEIATVMLDTMGMTGRYPKVSLDVSHVRTLLIHFKLSKPSLTNFTR